VILPESEGRQFFIDFVKNNTERSPILTNTAMLPLPDGWVSVPAGLLSLLTPADDSPAVSDLQRENDLLWAKYQDPTAGILTRHNHLMLSDVRDVYASARMRYGTVLLRAGELAAARDEFREAIRLGGDIQLEDAYTSLGLSELWLSECDAAISAFQKAREAAKIPNKEIIFYEAVTLRDCVGDEDRASVLFDEYERIREREQIPLESL
jgi:tetratricopeptide (TPR) repeat protein